MQVDTLIFLVQFSFEIMNCSTAAVTLDHSDTLILSVYD